MCETGLNFLMQLPYVMEVLAKTGLWKVQPQLFQIIFRDIRSNSFVECSTNFNIGYSTCSCGTLVEVFHLFANNRISYKHIFKNLCENIFNIFHNIYGA